MFLFDKQLITGDNNSAPRWHWGESLPRVLKEWSVGDGAEGGGEGRGEETGEWEGGGGGGDGSASKMKRKKRLTPSWNELFFGWINSVHPKFSSRLTSFLLAWLGYKSGSIYQAKSGYSEAKINSKENSRVLNKLQPSQTQPPSTWMMKSCGVL